MGEELHQPLMTSASQDPFPILKDELQAKASGLNHRLQQYKDMVLGTDTAQNVEFKTLKSAFTKELKGAEQLVGSLSGVVDHIEKNPNKFTHISEDELDARKFFVRDTQNAIASVKADMNSQQLQGKIARDEQKLLGTRSSSSRPVGDDLGASSAVQLSNTDYIHTQRQQQQQLIREQDETLGHLEQSVDRVGEMAININQELNEQNKMLTDLDNDLE